MCTRAASVRLATNPRNATTIAAARRTNRTELLRNTTQRLGQLKLDFETSWWVRVCYAISAHWIFGGSARVATRVRNLLAPASDGLSSFRFRFGFGFRLAWPQLATLTTLAAHTLAGKRFELKAPRQQLAPSDLSKPGQLFARPTQAQVLR